METKFTPAPWKVVQNTAGSWGINCMGSCDDNEGEIGIYSPTVASMWDVTHGKHENKDPQANAHLIAVAPEMYGMLERFLPYMTNDELGEEIFHGGEFVWSEDDDPMIDELKKLLAKARGE